MSDIVLQALPRNERDLALGNYMDAWSRLEGMIAVATREILQIDEKASRAISATLMSKQSIDLLEAAAKLHFHEEGRDRAKGLCEKLRRRNMRRNHIVHGEWHTFVVFSDDKAVAEWIRTYRHTDPDKAGLRLDDPKLLGLYTFTIPELVKASDHVEEMVEALSSLILDTPQLRA